MLDALNRRDVDAFVDCYTPEATIEDGHDTVVARGHAELRARYGPLLETSDIHVEPIWRTGVGKFVVQQERVTGRGEPETHVAVYLIAGDRIARERLIR